MMDMTCASPDFESAMLRLVMLVHCYQHDAGRPKERRLEAWRLAFPPGSADGSVPQVSVERLIKKVLEPFSAVCIANSNGWVCKEKIGGWKVQNCDRTLQELIKPETYSDDAKLEFLLKVMEWNRTCDTHQSVKHFTWVATWKKTIVGVLPLPTPLGDQALTRNTSNEPQACPNVQADSLLATTPLMTEKRAVLITQVLPSPRASPGPTISPDANPALYWPKAYDLSPFNILAHANHDASPTSSYKGIREKISSLLAANEFDPGYVYSYEVEGNKGYVKIGFTSRPVTKRHDEWSFECNRQTKPLYPFPAQAAAATSSAKKAAAVQDVLVPHARRVEALCHAELAHRSIRMYCSACMKQHIEWFEVSASEVAAVVQKWSRWMATRPYEQLQLRGRAKWTLKMSELQRTFKFEQFMREIAVVPAAL
jgi:hypothetical protein